MRAIVPRHPAETAQPEIRLVHQSGRLQRMARPLRAEMPRRDGPKLGIDQRQEPLERAVIPLLPGPENLGDFVDRSMIQGGCAAGDNRDLLTPVCAGDSCNPNDRQTNERGFSKAETRGC